MEIKRAEYLKIIGAFRAPSIYDGETTYGHRGAEKAKISARIVKISAHGAPQSSGESGNLGRMWISSKT